MTSSGARRTLTRHFFAAYFRLTFLDDAGEQSFKRAMIGLLSAILAFGLFVARLYAAKYEKLHDPAVMRDIVTADRLFALALPMFTTALACALSARGIFPDALDFRTLMSLPVRRSTIVAARVVAFGGFIGLFVAGSMVAFELPLALILSGRLSGEPRLLAIAAQLSAGFAGALFVAAAVTALEGVATLAAPAGWHGRASTAVQTLAVGALVVSLPVVLRASAVWQFLPRRPLWLLIAPPAWFVGLAECLMGDRNSFNVRLAELAIASTSGTVALAVLCWIAMYRRFDQTMLQPDRAWIRPCPGMRLIWPWRRHPATRGVSEFIGLTLRRSGLHQLVFACACAAGIAMGVSGVLGAHQLAQRWVDRAVLEAPFSAMAAALVGLRFTMLLPTNLRAGWLFRFLENADLRSQQLDAVRGELLLKGVVLPVVLTSPLLALHFGAQIAVALTPLTLLIGWTLAEALSIDWRRIPFTCTVLFAKRPPAYTVGLVVLIFGWFVFAAASALAVARAGALPWALVAIGVASVAITLRQFRMAQWGRWPLEFEDYLPDGVDSLRLRE